MFELKDVREEYQGSVFCRNSQSIHANSNLLVFYCEKYGLCMVLARDDETNQWK